MVQLDGSISPLKNTIYKLLTDDPHPPDEQLITDDPHPSGEQLL